MFQNQQLTTLCPVLISFDNFTKSITLHFVYQVQFCVSLAHGSINHLELESIFRVTSFGAQPSRSRFKVVLGSRTAA